MLFCLLTGRNLKYSPSQHGFIALQGLFLFSSNYLVFYWATGLLTSGIVALMFSTVILMNIVNAALFMGSRVRPRVVIGAGFGIAGIAAIFWAEVSGVGDNADTWRGLWMCLLATWFASIGNIISARNQKNKIPVIQTNAWGMAYGSLIMAIFALFSGVPFNYEPYNQLQPVPAVPGDLRFDTGFRLLSNIDRPNWCRQGSLCRGTVSGYRARSVNPV